MTSLIDPFLINPDQFDGPVLVTGASGCIGSWTIAVLAMSGVRVIASDLTEDRARLSLLIGADKAKQVPWHPLDVTDLPAVRELCQTHKITAIIHLAGLMIPFCKADPALGARVNVEGTINILEAARHQGIRRLAYASSSAVYGMPPGGPNISTLYGAYKQANEYTAKIYWLDWAVPSVGIRPNVVYGVGRDAGMTSEFSVGLVHVAKGAPFNISYTGPLSWLYGGEAASAFIAAISKDGEDAHVFDLNGPCMTVEEGLAIVSNLAPDHQLTASGAPIAIPGDLSDAPIRAHVGDYPSVSAEEGIAWTLEAFRQLHQEGREILR